MNQVTDKYIPPELKSKINELRNELGTYPEFNLDLFTKRIVRRPAMKGKSGLVFREPKSYDKHWFINTTGGDQDQGNFI